MNILGIFGVIVAIFLGIKVIMDLREGTGELLEAGKNPLQRFLYLIIGVPLMLILLLLGFAHDINPFLPYIAPTPTFSFPLSFPTPTP